MTKNKTVKATADVPFATKAIKKGTEFKVKRNYFYNGEGWYLFTDGTKAPDIFFEDIET